MEADDVDGANLGEGVSKWPRIDVVLPIQVQQLEELTLAFIISTSQPFSVLSNPHLQELFALFNGQLLSHIT